jgi:hypothetical protein
MDFFKEFLDFVCKDEVLYYAIEHNCAEIYIKGEPSATCMIEYDEDIDKYIVHFRMGLYPNIVALIMHRMTIHDSDIIIDSNFIHTVSSGVLYGEEAAQTYFAHVYETVDVALSNIKDGVPMGATYVVKEPIRAYEKENAYSSKIKKLWLDEEF